MDRGQFAFFGRSIFRRRRAWRWIIVDHAGTLVMSGDERSRAEAQYRATRATLQLLLTAPYQRQTAGQRERQTAACRTLVGEANRAKS